MKRGRKKGPRRLRSPGRRRPVDPGSRSRTGARTRPGTRPGRPQPLRPPTADDDVTVDKAARVLGSMVGKRLAARRKDDE